jgi:hypothetical protein
MHLKLDTITDTRCQLRASMNQQTVAEYAEAMREGDMFPPIIVYRDGDTYLVADGFHRVEAARYAGRDTIDADVREGTLEDACLCASGANKAHGLRRTNADKRLSVLDTLENPKAGTWSDREIARHCGVTHPFVAKMRRERSGNGYHPEAWVETVPGFIEKVDPTDLASDLPDGTPALAPFEDAMAQHNAWLAAIRGDIERMESEADLARICDTLETTATRMETLGIDAAETRRVRIRAMMHRGRAIKAVIAAGLEAAREAIAATTTPTGAQVRGWLDAITAAADLIHPDFEGIDEVQQFIDALEAIDRWINHERGYLVEARRIIEGELEKKRTAMA